MYFSAVYVIFCCCVTDTPVVYCVSVEQKVFYIRHLINYLHVLANIALQCFVYCL